jgi:hypothetical protein
MAKPSRSLPATLEAGRFLTRARQYHAQATELVDMDGFEPNWPKHLMVTHAIELALNAYFVFDKEVSGRRSGRGGKKPNSHDLMALYKEAIRRGLGRNSLVLKELPFLSKLHKIHYARYPQIESRPVPARISEYDEMLEQLFADVRAALGQAGT